LIPLARFLFRFANDNRIAIEDASGTNQPLPVSRPGETRHEAVLEIGDLLGRATIDRLWNRFVAAWYEGGKDDPKLQLLRFDPARAQVWLNENSLTAGIKLLFGRDPKKEYADKVADVDLTKRAG